MGICVPALTLLCVVLAACGAGDNSTRVDGGHDASDMADEWPLQIGGAGSEHAVLRVGRAGDVYIAATFVDSVHVGGEQYVGAENEDILVAKLSPRGEVRWVRWFGGVGREFGTALALDDNEDVVLGGYFTSTFDFGGEDLIPVGFDAYVAKLRGNDGGHVWSVAFGGAGDVGVQALEVGSDNSTVITGPFDGTVTIGAETFTASDPFDMFLAKLGPDGNVAWAKDAPSSDTMMPESIGVDARGHIYLCGSFRGTADLGGDTLLASGQDVFVAEYDERGEHVWSRAIGGASDDAGFALAVDESGDVFVGGEFKSAVDFGGGVIESVRDNGTATIDAFVAKYAGTSGAHLWSTASGGGGHDRILSLVPSPDGVLATGFFEGSARVGGNELASVGSLDVLLVAYERSSGAVLQADSFGGVGTDGGTSIGRPSTGGVLIAAQFSDSLLLGDEVLVSDGEFDVLVAHWP